MGGWGRQEKCVCKAHRCRVSHPSIEMERIGGGGVVARQICGLRSFSAHSKRKGGALKSRNADKATCAANVLKLQTQPGPGNRLSNPWECEQMDADEARGNAQLRCSPVCTRIHEILSLRRSRNPKNLRSTWLDQSMKPCSPVACIAQWPAR